MEFGLIRENPADANTEDPETGLVTGNVKVIGAGILSSFGEMEWSSSPAGVLPSKECRQMGGITEANGYDVEKLVKPVQASNAIYHS